MCVPPDSPGLHQGGVDGGSDRSWDTEGVSHIPKDPLSASDIDILNGFRKTHPHTADRQIILPDSDSPRIPFPIHRKERHRYDLTAIFPSGFSFFTKLPLPSSRWGDLSRW